MWFSAIKFNSSAISRFDPFFRRTLLHITHYTSNVAIKPNLSTQGNTFCTTSETWLIWHVSVYKQCGYRSNLIWVAQHIWDLIDMSYVRRVKRSSRTFHLFFRLQFCKWLHNELKTLWFGLRLYSVLQIIADKTKDIRITFISFSVSQITNMLHYSVSLSITFGVLFGG